MSYKTSFFNYTPDHLNHNPNTQLLAQKRGLQMVFFYSNTSRLHFYLNAITALMTLCDVNNSSFSYYITQFVPYYCESWQFGGNGFPHLFFHTSYKYKKQLLKMCCRPLYADGYVRRSHVRPLFFCSFFNLRSFERVFLLFLFLFSSGDGTIKCLFDSSSMAVYYIYSCVTDIPSLLMNAKIF